jgi:hypothetical protein
MLTTMTPSVEPEETLTPASAQQGLPDDTPLTNAELVQLRIRVIALGSLVDRADRYVQPVLT